MARAAAEAASNERLALARDLHDLVSHGLGTITIRAAVARRSTTASDPCGVALADIETTSRQATVELRRMLKLLRDESAPPYAPTPDDEDVDRLLADTRARGVGISYETAGMGDITKGAWLVTYRVLQEALANVERHAGPTKADLTCRQRDGTITIEVSDHGPQPGWTPEPGAGLGLLGLRERLESVGGTLAHGPRSNSGFRLVATFPDQPPEADDSAS